MTKEKTKEKTTIGFAPDLLDGVDWELARSRVMYDAKSDFILAPHLSAIFSHAFSELKNLMESDLRDGRYAPGIPITIDVPKTSRAAVRGSNHFGPTFTRPGSILFPKDRLLYQIIADGAAPIVEKTQDRSRSFSHQMTGPPDAQMFSPQRVCWQKMQTQLREICNSRQFEFAINGDISNYFQTINQHILVNYLRDLKLHGSYVNALERLLLNFSTERSSRGILQGLFPSDLLGNFYLAPIDQLFSDRGVTSVRYVDDIYVFFCNFSEAERFFSELIEQLRFYDLSFNEYKTYISTVPNLLRQESELDELFRKASEEVREELTEVHAEPLEIETDYGFQTIWETHIEEPSREEVELEATRSLFRAIGNFKNVEDKIERFCLPVFSKGNVDIAVDYVLSRLETHPAMAQIYCAYLSKFIDRPDVRRKLESIVLGKINEIRDWPLMWCIGALLIADEGSDALVRNSIEILTNSHRHEALRAICAIHVAKFGTAPRRRELIAAYQKMSSIYIQAAILYGSRYLSSTARYNAIATWGESSELHRLVSAAVRAHR
jgi:hypothetical protein